MDSKQEISKTELDTLRARRSGLICTLQGCEFYRNLGIQNAVFPWLISIKQNFIETQNRILSSSESGESESEAETKFWNSYEQVVNDAAGK